MLFYGPPGTGKTSTILALSRQLFGPELFRTRVLELNASDERGISIVREKIKNFARQTPRAAEANSKYPCPPYKIIILDEADSMTQDAQAALRRIMENYAKITRFCLVCNYVTRCVELNLTGLFPSKYLVNRIIEPLASRCSKFRFHPLDVSSTRSRLEHIVKLENIDISPEAVTALISTSDGDLRRSITYLQSAARLSASQEPSPSISASDIQEIAGVVPDAVMNRFSSAVGIELPDEGMDIDRVAKDIDGIRNEVNRIMQEGFSVAQLLSQTACAAVFAAADKALCDGADEELQLLEIGLGVWKAAIRVPQCRSRSLASTVLLPKSPEKWQEYTVAQLRTEAKQRGLATILSNSGGSKSKLVQRLASHNQTNERPSTSVESPSTAHISARQRWISTGSYSQAEPSGDKFKARFSRNLDVKIPTTPERIYCTDHLAQPFLAQKFDSPPSESASPPQEPPSDAPKVVTVASAATHVGGGPSHAIHEATDAHSLESEAGSQPMGIKGLLEEFGLSLNFNFKDTANDTASEFLKPVASGISIPNLGKDETNIKDAQRELNQEEKQAPEQVAAWRLTYTRIIELFLTTMSSALSPRGRSTASATRGVRFLPESHQRILDLPTWRRPVGPEVQGVEYEVSAKAHRGMMAIRFAVSKLLFIRLPTSRFGFLDDRGFQGHCAQLLSNEQLAYWWSKLAQSDQSLVENLSTRSLRADASYFCEALAEISDRFGSQAVVDRLLPLVIPVISSWSNSGKLVSVDEANATAAAASKGKKAGNALGEARAHYFQEYCRRKTHFETYDDPGLKEIGTMTRLKESCMGNTVVVGKTTDGSHVTISIGSGIGPSNHRVVARELAAEAAVKNWHTVESYMEAWGMTKSKNPSLCENGRGGEEERQRPGLYYIINTRDGREKRCIATRRAAQPNARQSQPPRRTSVAPRAGTSRLNTPAIRASIGPGHDSVSEDQDMRSEASYATVTAAEATGLPTYVKTPELTVVLSGHFPEEVRRILGSSESDRNASTGQVDILTGYSFLVTKKTCFVWNPTKARGFARYLNFPSEPPLQRSHGSPTCYIFPTPRENKDATHTLLPNVSLIPYGASREPGLLIVSTAGEIRIWESINAGLAGAEHFYTTSASLSGGEYISSLYRCEASFYILATTSGRLLRMVLSSPGGKTQTVIAPFSQHHGLLSFSRFFGRGTGELDGGAVVAISETASETRQARSKNIWALTKKTLQKWTIGDGWEQMPFEYDVRASVQQGLVPEDQEEAELPELDIELHDLKMQGNEHALILFSYLPLNELESTDSAPYRTYAIASFAPAGDALTSIKFDKVPYEGTRDPRPASNPTLELIDNGNVALVQFVDAVTLQSLNAVFPGSTFKTHLMFKDRRWNRTLGHGVSDKQAPGSNTVELMLMTVTSGQLSIHLDLSRIKRVDDTSKVNQSRAIMEQAIRFGTIQDNPFVFRLDPELKEADLGSAAVGLSRDIVNSAIHESRHAMDLSQHINQRLGQLQALMRFLNEDHATAHMSDSSRQSLAYDAEKLFAATLVCRTKHSCSEHSGQRRKSLLTEIIERYFGNDSAPSEEGPVRAFFKGHLEDLAEIIINADYVVDDAYRSGAPNLVETLRVANQLIIYNTVNAFRQQSLGFYGLEDAPPSLAPWTSEPEVLETMQELFTYTGRMLGDRARDLGNTLKTVPAERDIQNELKGQLQDLAKYLFANYSEQNASAEDRKEAVALDQQFANYRPSMLRNLATYDQGEDAFQLAEQYRDFRSLAELCNDSKLASDLRTQNYLERYQQDFASELYQWYVEHGKLQTLLLQDKIYWPLLHGFLQSTDYPRISWLHDIAVRDFQSTTATLSGEIAKETKLDAKQVGAKNILDSLSTVAENNLESFNSGQVQDDLQVYDDQLDLVELQREIRVEFDSVVAEANVRGRPSIDVQADVLAQELIPSTVEDANNAVSRDS
ncbi:replication factor C [Rhizoctonia solani AG-1 IA]|uniref:Replication factor C n=1 Tax=Thanatephorus cucumeris (strain AG1-IA) TaxID=983506 RepID=L8X3H3_THACA|nr:replication factor C [Rhizoctonia solani AG-1 IA]